MDTASSSSFYSPSPFSILPAQLAKLQQQPHAPLLLDVRRRPRFIESDRMLAGARYCAPEHVQQFAASHPPGEVIVYCVYGHEVSQQAAQALRAAGWTARYLAGGIEGGEPGVDAPEAMAAWRSVRPLTVAKRAGDDVPEAPPATPGAAR